MLMLKVMRFTNGEEAVPMVRFPHRAFQPLILMQGVAPRLAAAVTATAIATFVPCFLARYELLTKDHLPTSIVHVHLICSHRHSELYWGSHLQALRKQLEDKARLIIVSMIKEVTGATGIARRRLVRG